MKHVDWRKSTHSIANGECIEAASAQAVVAVRDTADRAGPVLAFGTGVWRAFTAGLRAQ